MKRLASKKPELNVGAGGSFWLSLGDCQRIPQ